jgi:uncharacterized protein (TIGR00730 family)
MTGMRSICVFAGSSPGARPEYLAALADLATALVKRDLHVVYGGANVGGMGALYDAVTAAGGRLTGVIPRALVDIEVANTRLDDLRIVDSMHERKALMAELSDAFIAVPGGLGTLEEFTEVTTWTQLGLRAKPTGLLNIADYYSPLLTFLDRAVSEGFLAAEHRHNILASTDPETLIEAMQAWKPVDAGRWWEPDPS